MQYFSWNPPSVLFTIPWLQFPIRIYSLCFAAGIIWCYFCIKKQWYACCGSAFSTAKEKMAQIDSLLLFSILGIVIGARLGEVFFYNFQYYQEQPLAIFKTWEGGLSSHGGIIGLLIAIGYYYRKKLYQLQITTWWHFLNWFTTPALCAGACIRIGNFFNQEIVGTETTLPWAVIFVNPLETVSVVPRHPVQLYEATAYLLFALVWSRLSKKREQQPKRYIGLFFCILFSLRFFLEYVKQAERTSFIGLLLTRGQWLSLPLILMGIFLSFSRCRPRN